MLNITNFGAKFPKAKNHSMYKTDDNSRWVGRQWWYVQVSVQWFLKKSDVKFVCSDGEGRVQEQEVDRVLSGVKTHSKPW